MYNYNHLQLVSLWIVLWLVADEDFRDTRMNMDPSGILILSFQEFIKANDFFV